MSRLAFQPTEAQRSRYAHYSVKQLHARHPVSISSAPGGRDVRVIVDFLRIPSDATFRWRPRMGTTPTELAVASRWAERLRLGWWAEFSDLWFRHRFVAETRWYWFQSQGFVIDDMAESFERWELELTSTQRLPLAV